MDGQSSVFDMGKLTELQPEFDVASFDYLIAAVVDLRLRFIRFLPLLNRFAVSEISSRPGCAVI